MFLLDPSIIAECVQSIGKALGFTDKELALVPEYPEYDPDVVPEYDSNVDSRYNQEVRRAHAWIQWCHNQEVRRRLVWVQREYIDPIISTIQTQHDRELEHLRQVIKEYDTMWDEEFRRERILRTATTPTTKDT